MIYDFVINKLEQYTKPYEDIPLSPFVGLTAFLVMFLIMVLTTVLDILLSPIELIIILIKRRVRVNK